MSKTVSFSWVSELLALDVTAGGQMCLQLQDIERMIFDSYPIPDSKNWMHNDDVVMRDFWRFDFFTAFNDNILAVDQFIIILSLTRSFDDTVGTSDAFYWQLDWRRTFDETVTVTDAVAFEFTPDRIDDQITVPDAVALHITKVFADTVAVSDTFSNGKSQNLNDSVAVSDHGSIYSQGYFDATGVPNGYFAADYFGYAYSW